MKIRLFVLLFILTGCCFEGFCQEEFFNDHNGVSIGYARNLSTAGNAFGLSAYSNRDFLVGLSLVNTNGLQIPGISFIICPGWKEPERHLKIGLGPSYSYVKHTHILGFHLGVSGCFNNQGEFPGCVTATASSEIAKPASSLNTSYQQIQDNADMSMFVPVFGIGYTQAFFAHAPAYPFISLSTAWTPESAGQLLFSASAGFNLRFD